MKTMHIHNQKLEILCGENFEEVNSTPNFKSKLATCPDCIRIALLE